MVLTEQEESLITVVRALPANEADKLIVWAQQLAELSAGKPIEWADGWSEEDMAEVTALAIRNFEESEREGL